MSKTQTRLSIRLDLPGGTRFGPGKAKLLEAIDESGSVSGATRLLEMSYPRALRLVSEMNQQFKHPLIEKFQGGATRGGATLTDYGRSILELYQSITGEAAGVNRAKLAKLSTMVKR